MLSFLMFGETGGNPVRARRRKVQRFTNLIKCHSLRQNHWDIPEKVGL